jgi:hypothetical protein
MAYASSDFEVRMLFENDESTATAQVNMAVATVNTPTEMLTNIASHLASGSSSSPLEYMNSHAHVILLQAFSLSLHGVVAELAIDDVGLQGTGSMPVQAALVWTLLTGTPGRSHRGRIYWPFIDSGLLLPGGAQWNPAFETVGEVHTNWQALMTGSGDVMSVNSRKNQELELMQDIRPNFQYIGTQRRRSDRFVT